MAERGPKRWTERLAPRLGELTRAIVPAGRMARVEELAETIGPAARLARIDMGLLRAWMRNAGPVADALGEAEGRTYTALVVAAAERDPRVARVLAFALPDHLARVPPEGRGRYSKLLRAVMHDRIDALPLVTRTLPELLGKMDDQSLSRYVAHGLQLYGESIQKAESFLRMESGRSHETVAALSRGMRLADVQRTLALYARAHCGEDVQVRPGDAGAFTDGRHLYLPAVIDHFDDPRDFLIYRVLTARNAGFLEFGTMNLDLATVEGDWPDPKADELPVERMLRGFANVSIARDLFRVLEGARIEARVRGEYPGVARDMDGLAEVWRPERPDVERLAPAEQAVEALARAALGMPELALPDVRAAAAARDAVAALAAVLAPEATVETTVREMRRIYGPIDALMRRAEPPGRPPDRDGDSPGGSRPERDEEGRPPEPPRGRGRGDRDDALDHRPAAGDPFGGELRLDRLGDEARGEEARAEALLSALRARAAEATRADARREARRDGSSYEEMSNFLDRLEAPAGPMTEGSEPDREVANLPVGDTTGQALHADAETTVRTFLYPEWDHHIDDYKPRWVRLAEYRLLPGSTDFVDDVRRRHGALIGQVRRSFEALRPESIRRVRGEPDGDEIDLDRVVEAQVARRAGGTPGDRLYTRHLRDERDVAVAFLVDMSSSTNELASNVTGQRIIDVEKEALVLIAEAVDAIGDAAAIYGFSGYGRDQVAFYIAKDFDDPWDHATQERIGRISWKMENRDGAAIRHAARKLADWPAKVKLLLLLSDGKPLDCGCDHYSDRYAQEDTRVALQEARKLGIHPFCITVDPHGQEYLSRMYGDVGYTVIDRVDSLPRRLPMIYRRLTR